MSHKCHADNCTNKIPPSKFMCAEHWALVDSKLKQRILDTYIEGQEKSKRPSRAYLQAAREAICDVMSKEKELADYYSGFEK